MTVRVIASDLDGTLFGPDHRLAPQTIEALRRARSAGLKVVAATGRAPTSAVDRLAEYDVVDALVCSNGALVHDIEADQTLHRFCIDDAHLEALFPALDAALPGLSYCWEMEHSYGWDSGFDAIARQHDDLHMFDIGRRPGTGLTVSKLMVAHPDVGQEALAALLIPHLPAPLNVACSGVQFVEITAVGVNKATALEHVIADWDLDATDVVAFGDNQNDAAMLQWAGHGVAVANAVDAAKQVADEVIGHHGEHSVARYIEELLGTLR